MRLFFTYLKEHSKIIMLFIVFAMVFFISFLLYHLPMKAILYPVLICSVIGILSIIFNYIPFYKKHNTLLKLHNFTSNMITDFKYHSTSLDLDYQKIICNLQKEINKLEEQSNTSYQNMIDYYTIWVHQIKTPIASMRLSLQNEDSILSCKLQSDLFRIEQYVEMVLTYLRLDSSTSDYVFQEYNLDRIIKDSLKKFSHEFINKKISLFYDPIHTMITTDDKWLSFVIEQILSNALKYTNKGSIKIYQENANTLCVKDTGIGINAQDIPRIFQKGYTGYNGRTDKKASGIGLYLCQLIGQKLGIDFQIVSKIGEGTIVKILFQQ